MQSKAPTTVMRNIKEKIKLVVIGVLFMSMLLLYAVYISAAQSATVSLEQEIPWEKLMIFKSGFNPKISKVNPDHIIPRYICVIGEGRGVTSLYDPILTSSLYGMVTPYLSEVFSHSAQIEKYSADTGAALWSEALAMSDYIYLRFTGNLPLAAYSLFLCPNDANFELLSYGQELILYPHDGIPAALVRDANGEITRLVSSSETTVFNNENIREYTNIAGASQFSFANKDVFPVSIITADTFPVPSTPTYCASVTCENPVTLDVNSRQYDLIKTIMQRMGYNTDVISPYTDPSGKVQTHSDSSGTLKITATGFIYYTAASNSGLHLSEFLGYNSDEYSVWDMIKASSILVDSMPAALCGGDDAEIRMSGVYRDGNDVYVGYSYFIDGIRVIWSDSTPQSHDISIKFTAGRVSGLSLRCMNLSRSTKVRNLPMDISILLLDSVPDKKITELDIMYRVDFSDDVFLAKYYTAYSE